MTRRWPVLTSAVTAMPGASGTCRPADGQIQVKNLLPELPHPSHLPRHKKFLESLWGLILNIYSIS